MGSGEELNLVSVTTSTVRKFALVRFLYSRFGLVPVFKNLLPKQLYHSLDRLLACFKALILASGCAGH